MATAQVDVAPHSAFLGGESHDAALLRVGEDAYGRAGFAWDGHELALMDDHERRSIPISEARSWNMHDGDGVLELTMQGDEPVAVRLNRCLQPAIVATLTRLLGPAFTSGGPS